MRPRSKAVDQGQGSESTPALALPAKDWWSTSKPTDEPKEGDGLKSWALVELFGHQRIVGFLSQQTMGSGVLFRVDVPDLLKDGAVVRKGFTRYLGLGAIYAITPIDETTVRELLPSIDGTPAVRPLSLRSYGEADY